MNGNCIPSSIPMAVIGVRVSSDFRCPTCIQEEVSSAVQWSVGNGEFSWCLSVRCSDCQRLFYMCTLCECNHHRLVAIPMTKAMKKHHSKYRVSYTTVRMAQLLRAIPFHREVEDTQLLGCIPIFHKV